MVLVGVLVAAALLIIVGMWLGDREKARHADEEPVLTRWEGLRATRSELIEGNSTHAPRHRLAGLTARVEDSGTNLGSGDDRRVHVIIEGAGTAIVKSVKVAHSHNVDARAREFTATFNMLSKQAGI